MERNIKSLIGYRVVTTDGEIGEVDEFYFDDQTWTVRYAIVKLEGMHGRRVLIATDVLTKDDEARVFFVSYTKNQVVDSPLIDIAKPVSRQQENDLYWHYGGNRYWENGESTGGLRRSLYLDGFHVHAMDGEFGSICELNLDDVTWQVRHLVVEMGWPTGGKKILIPIGHLAKMRWADAELYLNETIAEAEGHEHDKTNDMTEQNYDFGMIGLGTMGRNLVFNMNDHGYSVAGFDKDEGQVEKLKKEAGSRKVLSVSNLAGFVKALKVPRVILMLVPAGKVVDAVIAELKPLLSSDDLLMDCGNSHFSDTDRRDQELEKSTIHFMGVGISGGEAGARYGPSIMPGGPKAIYARVAPMLEAISAKVNKEPCVTWLGPGSAGHYVKMVHNGIEYGLMQLISEAYDLLKLAGKMDNDGLHRVFSGWNKGRLQSYLMEITAAIFVQKDTLGSGSLVDMILDSTDQNGTGAWTSQDALNLKVPVPNIDIAVSMRNVSAYKTDREQFQHSFNGPETTFSGDISELADNLEQALYFSMLATYIQGMALLSAASAKYAYHFPMEGIAKIWRGGCIIRAGILDDICSAFSRRPDLTILLSDDAFAGKLMQAQKAIRQVIQTGVRQGIPLPGMMGALAWFDSFRSGWLPANLVQAQRDYFGAHTYKRNDRAGIFHTLWAEKSQ